MSENELHEQKEQGLVPVSPANGEDKTHNEYMEDLKGQAQEYQQKLQDAALKAKDYANEKFSQASDKFKELQQKDPKELVEDAKEYAVTCAFEEFKNERMKTVINRK